jgi:uncharacterized protein YdeI (YjbR/CyaY-like superfamily)
MSPAPTPHDVLFLETPEQLRDWFDAYHQTATELWLGYHKKATGLPTVTWQQAVDEALCVGWIDSVRYALNETSSAQRFTPRRKGSIWSAINTKRAAELIAEGRMRPAGLVAFGARSPEKTAIYSYERQLAAFTDEETALFQADAAAWTDWEKRSPSYRKGATHWVVSAKRPETRARRLRTLIDDSRAGRRIGVMP